MKTILVCGAKGQLGSELMKLQADYTKDVRFVGFSKEDLDINDYSRLMHVFQQEDIDVVINCAAYTQVDQAEDQEELAYRVNAIGAGQIAQACAALDKQLIHVSTDYVFDGQKMNPYLESDAVNPITVYGKSKLEGEQLVRNNLPSAIIVRTSWLYSSFGHNFVKTMYRLGQERDSIGVVNDQFGSPTYAKSLALVLLKIITATNANWGQTYHYCNDGKTSWYEFAQAIMEISGLTCDVLPISSIDYPQLAVRPAYSVLDNSKIKREYNLPLNTWKENLKECIQLMEFEMK